MLETRANSNIVGTMLKTIAVNTKLMPLDPRSIVCKKVFELEKYLFNICLNEPWIRHQSVYLNETIDQDYVDARTHLWQFFEWNDERL